MASSSKLTVFNSIETIRQFLNERRRQNANLCVALVPTMGALHQGHLQLVRQACLYHDEEEQNQKAGRIGQLLEGATRPLHHDGMLQHAAKLFNIVQPNVAFFGKKDAQQLFAIQQMTAVLNFPVRIVPVETEREPDGLALSSRNQYLSAAERQRSLCLYKVLETARNAALNGADLATVVAQAQKMLAEAEKRDGIKTDYFAVVDPNTFHLVEGKKLEQFNGKALLLVAVFMGTTRLIDNMEIDIIRG